MGAKRFPSMTLLAGSIALALATPVRAGIVLVGGGSGCTLADAITTTNSGTATGSCSPLFGPNQIIVVDDQTLGAGDLPAITADVDIVSPGTPVTIAGNGTNRLFMIGDPNSAPTVSFSGLALSGGNATGGAGVIGGGGGGGLGGAIFVYDGNVSINQMTFTANAATGGASSGMPSLKVPFAGVTMGTGGGGGGGMFGSGGSAGNYPPPYSGGPGGSGGFGGGGGGGGANGCEGGGGGGAGGGDFGGSGGSFGATAGGPGGFAGGGGGGGAANLGSASQPGGSGGFGGGGGGGAGQCFNGGGGAAANGAAGGFGGGGGASGSFANAPGLSGGAGGFGGGGGANGWGESGAAVAGGGFGGGDAALDASYHPAGGGGGGGLGGAIFIRSGHVDIQNSAFSNNTATGGGADANANPGQGKGGAIFAMHITANANGNDQGMPTALPTVSGCANTFSTNSAADAGTTYRDNADTFGADRAGLVLACNDRIFADGFGTP